ncbi:hypothetical protein DRO64_07145 [Candidatus Bathyarchaeota archaeon]|nr:MAG: hypothetical protein DRO64_07145 [Candidatus Bathyarchaeota archaeon]
MKVNKDSSLREKVEGEFEEQKTGIIKLIKTLMESFLRSNSNYGAITDIQTDINRIYTLVKRYIEEKKVNVYVLKMGNRILLSRTDETFDDLYKVIRQHSKLQVKRDIMEIWDDSDNKILHLLVLPVRKHFPIKYNNSRQKAQIIRELSLYDFPG